MIAPHEAFRRDLDSLARAGQRTDRTAGSVPSPRQLAWSEGTPMRGIQRTIRSANGAGQPRRTSLAIWCQSTLSA
jgi:hypothetical protein